MSIKKAAGILTRLEPRNRSRILAFLEETDARLARQIRDEMLLFVDLLLVDERGLQKLLQEIDRDVLTTALKGADWPLVERVLDNLSPRSAENLREDLALAGPALVKDVEAARQTILQAAKQLQSRGALLFIGKGDDRDLIY